MSCKVVVVLGLCAAVAMPAMALAEGKDGEAIDEDDLYRCRKSNQKVRVSFKDQVTVQELVSWAMGFTCKNFVFGAGVKGRSQAVVFVTPKEMTAAQAWESFLVALRVAGLTVVAKGELLEVVEAQQAKGHVPTVTTVKDGERFQRALFRAEHADVSELERALTALKSKDGEILALSESGIVLVTDYGSHLVGMTAIVREIDRPRSDEHVYAIRVRHGDAVQIASTLEAILGTGEAAPAPAVRKGKNSASAAASGVSSAGSAAPTQILTDERTKTIIILGSDAAYQRAHALVRRLDQEISLEDSGHIHMYLLEHADAEKLAITLQSLITNRPLADKAEPTAARRSHDSIQGEVKVTFDEGSNALLVMSSMQDYLALREVIRRLDTRRSQVFIEATILDIRIEGDRLVRGAFHGGEVKDGALWLTGLQYDDLQTTELSSVLGLGGLLTGVVGGPLPGSEAILGKSIPSFAILFQAIATSRNANILSAPRVMTMDNTEATISVGQGVPSVRGAVTQVGAAGPNVTRTVEREDVSLTLKVTPHVNSADEVRLEIDLLIEDIIDSDPDLGPTTSKRAVKNTVVVGDQESVVIGGLVSDESLENETKVPLLGDLPVIGFLFRRTVREKRKRNLLILLTPYIVSDRADSDRILRDKLRERVEFARAFSSLESANYEPEVDYRRKRGLVEEINRSVLAIESERAERGKLDPGDDGPAGGQIWPPPGS